MKYVLMVGFCYQKYKKNLNVQIFSGSTMIDDLTVDEDIVDPAGKHHTDPVYALTHDHPAQKIVLL